MAQVFMNPEMERCERGIKNTESVIKITQNKYVRLSV
jgi:hypothetical protein